MAIPKIEKENILDALKYIDENGVPDQHQSTKYDLVMDKGKKYPPKYVVAVADHLANGVAISTNGFNAVDAKNFLENQGFHIEEKPQEKFELSITADRVESTDVRFTMDDLNLGSNYKPLDVCFRDANGGEIRRAYSKNEKKNTNQTMPRLAFQIFEKQIAGLSAEEKERFPVCKNTPDSDLICGIYSSVDAIKAHQNSWAYVKYSCEDGGQFVIYCWNLFSTILFVQECLKRFGKSGDRFILIYQEEEKPVQPVQPPEPSVPAYQNPFSTMLIESKNLIFRGAPGTGKTYLAKEIAADIISDGYFDDYTLLSEEQKKQVEFVQFHPNYDYSDFVEGLRPKLNEDGTMGFELQDGIFKKFVARARKNYEDFQTKTQVKQEELKKYIFIIDEINRGEISKIFGELFFAIDPGYRGKVGEITTQYANLHSNPDEKFYIPENVYLIGTMNDIDRSVDSFDFAMRRRFRFVELRADADESLKMLSSLEGNLKDEAKSRMAALNQAIAKVEDLNVNYQIGASYFLKLKTLSFDQLWTDYLEPLLREYVQGMYDEKGIMNKFAKAYGYQKPAEGDTNGAAQDRG